METGKIMNLLNKSKNEEYKFTTGDGHTPITFDIETTKSTLCD